jgi:hypothetical protein
MKRSWMPVATMLVCVGVAYGCGDDDSDAGGSHAGASGASGRAGGSSGGSNGHAGTGGHAGTSGSGASGHAGSSGRGSLTGGSGNAEGGVSGQAGAGAAGMAGGGASGTAGGGAGGSCDAGTTLRKLSSTCEAVPVWAADGTEDTIMTNCSFESACKAVGCGSLWSAYDASMCRRPLCHSSAECGTGERCVAPPLLGDFNCYFDPVSAATVDVDCSCGFELSECAPRAYCLSAADYPPADDCDVTKLTCYQLSYSQGPFDWLGPLQLESTSDLGVALDDCQTKIRAAYTACQGGAGGEGGGHSQ